MAAFGYCEWIVPFVFLYLGTILRLGASEVTDIHLSSSGRRILQQNLDNLREQGKILLEFRNNVKFPAHSKLTSWGEGDGAICSWMGVVCVSESYVLGIHLAGEKLQGTISPVISQLQSLEHLDLSDNHFRGVIPDSLCYLQQIVNLNLSSNALDGVIPSNIYNCSSLQILDLSHNSLSGSIPEEIGRLTKLEDLTLQGNQLGMSIPQALQNCVSLRKINMGSNNLVGPIPDFLGSMNNLQEVNLGYNGLSGAIPESLSRLSRLEILVLNANNFTGEVPEGLGLLQQLRVLNLGSNQLTGTLLSLEGSAFVEVQLNNNLLTGGIPEFRRPNASILTLSISHNLLTGTIPDSVRNLKNVQSIDFSFNNLLGSIPGSLGSLQSLASLDLSNNQLSGVIPSSLGQLQKLDFLDVSYNSLQGSIPRGWQKFPADSFVGNAVLCVSLNGNDCPPDEMSNGGDRNRTWIYIAVAIGTLTGGIVALSAAIWCTWKGKSSRARLAPIMEMSNFSDGVVLTVQDVITATERFGEWNIIGEGSKSVVYKGVLPDGMVVAVKKLFVEHNERAATRLNHEMQMLGILRHRNWLKIYGYLSSPEIKALVLEYAPNGSLHRQLHEAETCQLTWKMRLEIANGIAEALVHIHHELVRPIIHLDLKPSNVLLDENFVAKVTDLGISKLLYQGSRSGDRTTSALLGTTGYIPPEYGISAKVSTKGDVFNYGILLLELLTRKRPTFRFEGDISLRQWVSNAAESSDGMITVLDSSIRNELAVHEDQIHLLLRVGLLCTETSPAKRPSMKDVTDMLKQIESLYGSQRSGS